MSPATVVEVAGVSKRFGKTQAVDSVSLSLGAGEALGLVGPNGSGKTTLLRCASGLLRMDAGRSAILGHDVSKEHSAAMAALAFVPELPAPFPALTPREHLLFAARVFGLAAGWEVRAESVLRTLDLTEVADRLCMELSKGQKQKVHVAQAMLRNPPVVVLDEPLIGIDPKGVRAVKDWIRERVAAGGSFLVSSHALAFVEEVCQRIGILNKGRLLAIGTLDELRARSRSSGDATLEDAFLRLTEASVGDVLR